MTGAEVLKELGEGREARHCFVRWWRRENDFEDIELIDDFVTSAGSGEQFGGFELLDMEQMWDMVVRLCGDRVSRRVFDDHETVVWDRVDSEGKKRSMRCSYAPEFLIQVFDVETRGNFIG